MSATHFKAMVWADEASVIAQGPAQVHAVGCGGFAVRSRWIGRGLILGE
jgi:hypothetical protein